MFVEVLHNIGCEPFFDGRVLERAFRQFAYEIDQRKPFLLE
jgi:hypothetical protein